MKKLTFTAGVAIAGAAIMVTPAVAHADPAGDLIDGILGNLSNSMTTEESPGETESTPADSTTITEGTVDCKKIGYVGDSLSDFHPQTGGARELIKKRLTATGVPFEFSASAGRALIQGALNTGTGIGVNLLDGTGVEVLQKFKDQSVDCYVIALGTNDAAAAAGNPAQIKSRITKALSVTGDGHVEWILPGTNITGAAGKSNYADANMKVFRDELTKIAADQPNVDVNDWSAVATKKDYQQDNTHHNKKGHVNFADYVTDSLSKPSD